MRSPVFVSGAPPPTGLHAIRRNSTVEIIAKARRTPRPLRHAKQRLLLSVLLALSALPAIAQQDRWAYCSSESLSPPAPRFQTPLTIAADTLWISADRLSVTKQQGVFSGNVQSAHGTQKLKADRLIYQFNSERRLSAVGMIDFWDDDLYLSGDRLESVSDSISVTNPSFRWSATPLRISGHRAEARGDGTLRITDGQYTTCAGDTPLWFLYAAKWTIDRRQRRVTAEQARLHLLGIPLLYLPRFTYTAAAKRSSGMLTPKFSVSDSRGLETTLRYYFNLAPHYDATLSVRGMSRRGVQLKSELRYQYGSAQGQLSAEALPNDRRYGDDRFAVALKHHANLSEHLRAKLDFGWVSDQQYLQDLDDRLALVNSGVYIARSIRLDYTGDNWSASAIAQDFQLLDPHAEHPYQYLPQLRIRTQLPEKNRQFNWAANAESVNFHNRSEIGQTRLNLHYSLWYPVYRQSAFIRPRLSVDYTHYRLHHLPDTAAVDDSAQRLLPTLSIDGGLFFERKGQFHQRHYTHTLEPRLYYLLRPYTDQSKLPNLDARQYNLNFAQLFHERLFSGIDRLTDANRLTLALSSRLLDATGRQRAHLSVGQMRHFRARRVTLTSQLKSIVSTTLEDPFRASPVVVELSVGIARNWLLRGDYHYRSSSDEHTKQTLALRYLSDQERFINLGYRSVAGAVAEQADIAAIWPASANITVLGRFSYALTDDTILDAIAGLAYENCCVRFQALLLHYLSGQHDQHNTTLRFELHLKGLSHFRSGFNRSLIQRSFPGYGNL